VHSAKALAAFQQQRNKITKKPQKLIVCFGVHVEPQWKPRPNQSPEEAFLAPAFD